MNRHRKQTNPSQTQLKSKMPCGRVFLEAEEADFPTKPMNKKALQKKWVDHRAKKRWMEQFQDRNPVLIVAEKRKKNRGVYFLQLDIMDDMQVAQKYFSERNKTFRENFAWYSAQFLSQLIQAELGKKDALAEVEQSKEIYSLNLKKMNRNYSLFNEVLIGEGVLEVHSLHDAKEGTCIEYGIDRSFLKKGVRKRYLSKEEISRLATECHDWNRPDKTSRARPKVVAYFLEILKKTKVHMRALEELEVEAGRFKRLLPCVKRFQRGKFDAMISPTEGRFHANYTYAPSEFRSLMRYGGGVKFVEGDVAACHFHFLLDEMTDRDERKQMVKDLAAADPYLAMCGNPSGVSRDELKQSSHLFKFGTRSDVRRFVGDYESFAMVPYREGVFYRHLSAKYPVFSVAMANKPITHAKHRSDYACEVMWREAKVMVHRVGSRCMAEGLVYLPVHDGFLTMPLQFDRVCEILAEEFRAQCGSVPRIKRR
jgi:hypothetical protein